MAQPQVIILNDTDIWEKGDVQRIANLTEMRTFARDKLINNEFSITVKNFDNFYSVNNTTSYFSGENWRYGSLKIYNIDGDLVWDGIIRDIKRNHQTKLAQIITASKLHQKWNRKIVYTSSAAEDPATAAKNIMDTYDIVYNSNIMNDSIIKLTNNNCTVKVNFDSDDDVTLMSAIEKLAEYACADAYSHLGEVYFKHWQPFTGGVKLTINENDFKTIPTVRSMESEIINQYSIPYEGDQGTPITDTASIGLLSREKYGTHDLPGFDDGEDDAQISFTTQAAAKYIGECYIQRTHIDLATAPRPPFVVDFELKGTHDDWIDLETYFKMNLSDESWTDKVFEFFTTDRNFNTNSIKLKAVETQV